MTSSAASVSKEYLYAILNLPVSASQEDIHRRYKELGLIFHPDKQQLRDDNSIRIAEERFRQIQRAYEVLTDPVVREIYDTHGESGLQLSNYLSREFSRQVSAAELEARLERERTSLRYSLRHRGQATYGLDASDLFYSGYDLPRKGLWSRLQSVSRNNVTLEHTVGVNLDNRTSVDLTGRIGSGLDVEGRDWGTVSVLGTVRHQFSPRLHVEAAANLTRNPHHWTVGTTLIRNANILSVKTTFSQRHLRLANPPPFRLKLQRVLFPGSSNVATIQLRTGRRPQLQVGFASAADDETPESWIRWIANVHLTPLPVIEGSITTRLLPGGYSFTFHPQIDPIQGLHASVIGFWKSPIGTTIGIGTGVAISGPISANIMLEFSETRLSVPIILAYEADYYIGLCALIAPPAIAAVTYRLLIKPWLKARDIFKSQKMRELQRKDTEQRRKEAQETVTMLSRQAHRQTEREREIGGLVLLTATYQTSGEDDNEENVAIDVTIPLQAQVRDSQLMIPGGRSKADLLGFYDPLPGAGKKLKIEYLFHGVLHVVEVTDFSGVLLPQRAHLLSNSE
ncbi:hypothetical protein M422DRAFT_32881 [Sphaerobolus stellatus SS14]|uniref:J domain-containing protein n=1 Tax=Sphaerobolus stellatus (strain SS14) TaxID=990650 RepID=A0A0C9VBS5_SPHS4|nr:hypothetical protein M422DRAFT_32881 [Sphaerobolus stellatus SS14]